MHLIYFNYVIRIQCRLASIWHSLLSTYSPVDKLQIRSRNSLFHWLQRYIAVHNFIASDKAEIDTITDMFFIILTKLTIQNF